jgi:hypothetical protein
MRNITNKCQDPFHRHWVQNIHPRRFDSSCADNITDFRAFKHKKSVGKELKVLLLFLNAWKMKTEQEKYKNWGRFVLCYTAVFMRDLFFTLGRKGVEWIDLAEDGSKVVRCCVHGVEPWGWYFGFGVFHGV